MSLHSAPLRQLSLADKNFKKIAIDAAVKAGTYIRKNIGKIKNVRYKGEINIVTDIDKKAEDIVVGIIKRSFPKHNILAEEKKYAKTKHDFTWIIDPLDGTTNFLHGFPVFSVSIALADKGEVVTGVVYDPTRDEIFHSELKGGAFLNRKRICVSRTRDLGKSLVATGFAYDVRSARKKNIKNFINFLKASQAVRRAGSAALDLCYVACGRFDGFWEFYLHTWDTAAGLLLIKEAGGRVSRLNGSPYSFCDNEILASNSKIHSQMVRVLSK
ncbi:MAG: inositol monophosphatase [Candidatus Omnitrophica bacterium]|nr:inositol monophosphatase [Candidatus Omnitrophota bacterium]